ncbi:MAG: hypothetical protein V4662_15345 [Verrucomicrobiota bacterium]
MSNDVLSNRELKARIDTADFAETLAADADGSFYADVTSYMEAWSTRIKGYQDAGVSKAEFEELTRLSQSVQTAGRVLEFFVKLQKLPPAQPNEN